VPDYEFICPECEHTMKVSMSPREIGALYDDGGLDCPECGEEMEQGRGKHGGR
jgi:predicted RNA-binding Zn-ribbon protein involved in translation (DUF1610 family)